jgi:DMSO/TMAO reductase YedYZ molybdopterin-dependent catalytic subunit
MKHRISNSQQYGVDRRAFLSSAAIAAAPLFTSGIGFSFAAMGPASARAAEDAEAFPGMIVRQEDPLNLEFPFSTLDSVITPADRLFVRNHFGIPQLEASAWRLKIDGEVSQEMDLTYDALRKLPSKTVPATLECAGNGRSFLDPKAKGVQWELGGVSTAEWTGVPLAAVLEKAGIKEGAVEVILEGADSGEAPDAPGPIHFVRSLPIKKAKRPEVLLAYQMNGEDLAPSHGFPVRVIVPGWFGMASIKWLTRMTVTATPFLGYWQTLSYSYFQRDQGRPHLAQVNEIQVKSSIARPATQEVLPAGKPYRVFGAAWAGESNVAKVEFSSDGGQSWQPAKLLGEAVPYSWQLWEHEWRVPKKPGQYQLMARATDKRGATQPTTRDRDRRGYMINHLVPVDVDVR